MELYNISHFFNKRIYKVPDYQRGYSWEPQHIHDLLNDLKNALKLDSTHYMGTITLHPQELEERIGLSSYKIYHVVDGQQRFTTLTLILSYLIKTLQKQKEYKDDANEKEAYYLLNKGSYLFRYEVDSVSEEYFRHIITEGHNLSSLDENLYTRNLKTAYQTVKEYFEHEEFLGQELHFLQAIEERLAFNEYIVKSSSEIGVVFETMNNRGIGLSDLEIVKNRLLYLSTKINIKDEEHLSSNVVDKINKKWAIILKNLTLPNRVLDENQFLNNHWIIYYGWTKENQAKYELLSKLFTIEAMIDSPKALLLKIENYIDSLAVTSLHWRFINYPEEDNAFVEVKDSILKEKIKNAFSKLNRLSNSTVRPLLLCFIGLMEKNPEYILKIAELAEVYSFRLFSMNRRRSDTGKNDIYRNCNSTYENRFKAENQKYALYLLSYYIDVYGDWDRFILEIDELFDSNKKSGYYSWTGLNYFLYEYEERLRNNQDKKIDYSFAKQSTKSIEHVLPQDYKKNWGDVMKGLSKKESKKYIHSLGNLLMINSNKNSSLRNAKYLEKKEKYLIGTYSENELAKKKDWTLLQIEQREKLLLSFLRDKWRIDVDFMDEYPNPYQEENIEDDYTEADIEN